LKRLKLSRSIIDQHGWGSESQLAKKIGKSQEYISQRLSLLSLSKSIQNKIIRRLINGSVAQEIARLEDPKIQEHLSEEVVKHHLTVGMVRETARSIKRGESLKIAVRKADLKRISNLNSGLSAAVSGLDGKRAGIHALVFYCRW